jgi:hypothetical protein
MADQRLVTSHCRFHQRSLAVVCGNLPSQPASSRDHRQMAVTLCRRTQFTAGHGCRTRWDHHHDAIAVRRNRLVGGVTVIRAIGRYPNNPTVNLIKQRRHLGWIVAVLIGQGLRHDHAAGRVDRQMQFTPFPARFRTMFRLQPLTRPIDLQASAIDQHMQRTLRCRLRLDHRQLRRTTADRGVIRR